MKFQIWVILSLLPFAICSPLPSTSKRQTALTSFLALILARVPAINGPIEKVSGLLTAFTHTISILTWQQTTYNDLTSSAPRCKEYTLIFARGTAEPGNVGILVGPAFIEALKERLGGSGRLAVQGVKYEADVEGYLNGGDSTGSAILATQIETTRTKCPNTKLILSGYSQGGMIIHNAASLLSDPTAAWIGKVVIFGDPFSQKPVAKFSQEKVMVYCHKGDSICFNDAWILPAHLTYAIDARAAASFATS